MTQHYVRFASLAVNLQAPLTEYNLATLTKRRKRNKVLQREKERGGHLRTCVILQF
jgi:hypothetical protein